VESWKPMEVVHVDGKNKGKLMLYALSTCVWCKKTKELLSKLGVEFDYVYVDLERGAERSKAIDELKKFNPACSFPTLVVNDKQCIIGFKEQQIKEVLGL
jgi:glutaredoxin